MKRPLKPLKPRDLQSEDPAQRRPRRLYVLAYGFMPHPRPELPATRWIRRARREHILHAQLSRRMGPSAYTALVATAPDDLFPLAECRRILHDPMWPL